MRLEQRLSNQQIEQGIAKEFQALIVVCAGATMS
jgi:hypothetical protein